MPTEKRQLVKIVRDKTIPAQVIKVMPTEERIPRVSTVFDRAWIHWYKFHEGWYKVNFQGSPKMQMDFVVSFARKEVLRDRELRKP